MSEPLRFLLFTASATGTLTLCLLWVLGSVGQRFFAAVLLVGVSGQALALVDLAPLVAVMLLVLAVCGAWVLYASAERRSGKHRVR